MKKETKELIRILSLAIVMMMAVPLAYRVFIHFWPPDEKPRQTFAQFFEETQQERGVKLLTKPIAKWSETEMKAEPEIYAWLKEQSHAILPWEWTDEARRKDPKGYAKCWQRIWKERKAHCKRLLAEHQKEIKRLDRELQILTTIHIHRTNQIARLRVLVATNALPCQISLERLEKGRFWGWNRRIEVVTCKDAAATDSICSNEVTAAANEIKGAHALSDALTASKEKSSLCEKLYASCDKNNRLIESEPAQDHDGHLQKSLVEILKGGEK